MGKIRSQLPEGVEAHVWKDNLVLEVDGYKAKYQDKKWVDLNNYEKRKYENLLFLKFPKELPIFTYNTNK